MAKKSNAHVYELTFRVFSETPVDQNELHRLLSARLPASSVNFHGMSVGPLDCRELCFDSGPGGHYVCLQTKGHRGKHEDPSGKRWKNDS